MPQIGVFFLEYTSKAVCYRMIDWKKGPGNGLELFNEKALKSLNFLGLLAIKAIKTLQKGS